MAILLQRPHDARARPTTIIRDDVLYPKMFSEANGLEVYKFCAEMHFAVDSYFKKVRKKRGTSSCVSDVPECRNHAGPSRWASRIANI
jgi:hypothetical protein